MFMFFILLTVVSFFSVQFIPSIPKFTQIDLHCNDGSAILKYCPQQIDHCASDLLLSDRNETKVLVFDVSIAIHFLSFNGNNNFLFSYTAR